MRRGAVLLIVSLSSMMLAGCKREPPTAPAQGKPEVKVSLPLARDVTEYEYFTGHTEAFKRVDLRARVTGHLEQINFKDGDTVKENALLFVIDQRPFKAALAKANADLNQAIARRRRLEADFVRAQALLQRRGISQEDYDLARGNRDEAVAAVGSAEETVRIADQNLQYSEVRAPFAGRISRRLIDAGNLVKQDETSLSTIVTIEPMYAYFDVDERTLLRQQLSQGGLETARAGKVTVDIGLADETGYPHTGTVDFVDNLVDTNTGTLWMRAVFNQPKDGKLLRTLTHGLFIRVRFPVGRPHLAVLVAEQAIGTDQGQKFLYVLNEKNEVEYRQVTIGRLEDGLRVIKGEKFAYVLEDAKDPLKYRLVTDPKLRDGPSVIKSDLKPDERVVVSGLQRVRVNVEVKPEVIPMPIRAGATTQPATGVGKDQPAPKKPAREE